MPLCRIRLFFMVWKMYMLQFIMPTEYINIHSIFNWFFPSPLRPKIINPGKSPGWVCRNLAVGSYQILYVCSFPSASFTFPKYTGFPSHLARQTSRECKSSLQAHFVFCKLSAWNKGTVSLLNLCCAWTFLQSQGRWYRQIKHFQGNPRGIISSF